MNPRIVIFVFRIASRKPFIHLDFVIDVMGTGTLGVSRKGPQTSLKRTRCSFRCHVLKFLVRNSLAGGNNVKPGARSFFGAHSVIVLIWRTLSRIYIFSLHLVLSFVPLSRRLSCFVLCAFTVFWFLVNWVLQASEGKFFIMLFRQYHAPLLYIAYALGLVCMHLKLRVLDSRWK